MEFWKELQIEPKTETIPARKEQTSAVNSRRRRTRACVRFALFISCLVIAGRRAPSAVSSGVDPRTLTRERSLVVDESRNKLGD